MKVRVAIWLLAPALACAALSPVWAVGLGPLAAEGIIDGPRKAFQLTILNPYPDSVDFRAYSVGLNDEAAQPRVTIVPAQMRLGPNISRRLIVIASDLAVDETYTFRVCAERVAPPEGIQINARVCSKLSAHRVR